MRLRSIAPPLVFALLALGFGITYGLETDRWRPSPQLSEALTRMHAVPTDIGDWKSTDLPYEPEDFARAGIRGTVYRRYTNTRTRASVTLLLVCGRGGPISVHTPDICYAGAGYRSLGKPESKSLPVGLGAEMTTFTTLQFDKPNTVDPTRLEIYWAWCSDQKFESPKEARFSLGRLPALYKIYVVRQFAPSSRASKDNPCEDFIRRALPEIQAALARPE